MSKEKAIFPNKSGFGGGELVLIQMKITVYGSVFAEAVFNSVRLSKLLI